MNMYLSILLFFSGTSAVAQRSKVSGEVTSMPGKGIVACGEIALNSVPRICTYVIRTDAGEGDLLEFYRPIAVIPYQELFLRVSLAKYGCGAADIEVHGEEDRIVAVFGSGNVDRILVFIPNGAGALEISSIIDTYYGPEIFGDWILSRIGHSNEKQSCEIYHWNKGIRSYELLESDVPWRDRYSRVPNWDQDLRMKAVADAKLMTSPNMDITVLTRIIVSQGGSKSETLILSKPNGPSEMRTKEEFTQNGVSVQLQGGATRSDLKALLGLSSLLASMEGEKDRSPISAGIGPTLRSPSFPFIQVVLTVVGAGGQRPNATTLFKSLGADSDVGQHKFALRTNAGILKLEGVAYREDMRSLRDLLARIVKIP